MGYQIAVDATDPHARARFRAAALEFVLEDDDAFIRSLPDQGQVGEQDVVEPGAFHTTLADPEGNGG